MKLAEISRLSIVLLVKSLDHSWSYGKCKIFAHELKYLAMQHKCVAVCFSHTHVPVNEVSSGIRFINPLQLHSTEAMKFLCSDNF